MDFQPVERITVITSHRNSDVLGKLKYLRIQGLRVDHLAKGNDNNKNICYAEKQNKNSNMNQKLGGGRFDPSLTPPPTPHAATTAKHGSLSLPM